MREGTGSDDRAGRSCWGALWGRLGGKLEGGGGRGGRVNAVEGRVMQWRGGSRNLRVAKVADLEHRLRVVSEEGVLQFDVPVDDPLVVHVVHSAYQLLEEPTGLELRQPLPGADPIEEVASRGKLHRDAKVPSREERLLEFYDVRVVEGPLVVDLALHIVVYLCRKAKSGHDHGIVPCMHGIDNGINGHVPCVPFR